ncbi:hypothetical protein EKS35_16730, partial [Enterobacter hormaechei subsp. steigerwaltii]
PPGPPGLIPPLLNTAFLSPGFGGGGGPPPPPPPPLSAHPCASPRPSGNASAIYSRTRASLKALSQSEDNVIASAFKLLRNPLPIRGHFPSCAVTICLCKTIEDNKDIAYQ